MTDLTQPLCKVRKSSDLSFCEAQSFLLWETKFQPTHLVVEFATTHSLLASLIFPIFQVNELECSPTYHECGVVYSVVTVAILVRMS